MLHPRLLFLAFMGVCSMLSANGALSGLGHVWNGPRASRHQSVSGDKYSNIRDTLSKRAGFYSPRNKWTANTIPIMMSDDTEGEWKVTLQSALDDWATQTCLTFPEATGSEPNYIFIDSSGSGCSSSMGMSTPGYGRQNINLGYGCHGKYTALHELAHAIGYMHEYWRPDREAYITFNESLMAPGEAPGWAPYSWSQADTLGLPYDYASVMHPGQKGNGIVISKDPYWQNFFGSFYTLSYFDIKATNKLYGCADHCGDKTCPGQGFLDKNCDCQCPGWPIKRCDSNERDGPGFECKDYDSKCEAWSQDNWCDPVKMRGDKTMREDCKQTCGVCDFFQNVPPACYDLDSGCQSFAQSGQCSSNSEMAAKCQRSCNLCSY